MSANPRASIHRRLSHHIIRRSLPISNDNCFNKQFEGPRLKGGRRWQTFNWGERLMNMAITTQTRWNQDVSMGRLCAWITGLAGFCLSIAALTQLTAKPAVTPTVAASLPHPVQVMQLALQTH